MSHCLQSVSGISRAWRVGVAAIVLASWGWAGRAHAQVDPEREDAAPTLLPVVQKLIDDPLNTPETKTALRIFHGQWDGLNESTLTPQQQADLALARGRWNASVLRDERVDPLTRASAAWRRGDADEAHRLLEHQDSAPAAVLDAKALVDLGRLPEAVARLTPIREVMLKRTITDAPSLTAAGEALAMLATLEGLPAHDYQLALSLFTKAHETVDRFYWPALVAEAGLLADKGNRQQAVEALSQALSLNPRCAEAWLLLGQITATSFNFDKAGKCVEEIFKIDPFHPYAEIVQATSLLKQKDPDEAAGVTRSGLSRYPKQRELLALACAAEALSEDPDQLETMLAGYDRLSPGSAKALAVVGESLSSARQYDAAEKMLRRAIEREPNWPEPRTELGLLLMQSGAEEHALVELRKAVDLDPFQTRAVNQLKLVEHLKDYATIRTENFIIKYLPGAGGDEVLARDMAVQLEPMYREVTSAFNHRPRRKTLIEIMPDAQWFAVRITGLPELWTIAASTGDVIALTPPREGSHQKGTFDWMRVVRHEFTHTVTLDQTDNRIAHWFTEACAVGQEPGGRDFNTYMLLAKAYHGKKLFDLDQINWGFIRPKTKMDRPLAYAQAHWMLEYLTATFGHDAVLKVLSLYRRGVGDVAAIEEVTGEDAKTFMDNFRVWAGRQVTQWGLNPPPEDEALRKVLAKGSGAAVDEVNAQLERFANQPDLLKINAEKVIQSGDAGRALAAVLRYAGARPVDTWSDRMIVPLAIKLGQTQRVIASLETLAAQDVNNGDWGYQLAKLYRAQDQLPSARAAIASALRRDPYNATYRELSATLALQDGDSDFALREMENLTILEPDRAVHFVRLAAMYQKLGRPDDAKAAAEKARKLDPSVDVTRFISE
ncbi:MAG: tetratricopeptide repeat protein [Phycisphaera sp.]|nr:tetratricopeptide repeat protein [Phycisphaera sp.]